MSLVKKLALLFFTVIFIVAIGAYFYRVGEEVSTPRQYNLPLLQLADSPLDASYLIDEKEVQLSDGYAEQEIVSESASKAITQIFGELVYGDLVDGGEEESALILTHSEDGSGTFYYIAAAVSDGTGYLGTNTILLGDRITPQEVEIENSVIYVRYREYGKKQVMSDEPTQEVVRYFTLSGAFLREVGPLRTGEEILSGELVYGHESHTFTPCFGEPHWIAPDSRARAILETIYIERTRELKPYTPVFMVIGGSTVAAPAEGFGADYTAAVDVERVVTVPIQGVCQERKVLTPPKEDIQ